MTRRLSIPVAFILAVAALVALYGGYATTIPSTAAVDQDVIVSITGLIQLDGEDAIVEILVVVRPGEDAETRARDALHDLYPDAVEVVDEVAGGGSGDVESEQFVTNGLVWDTQSATVNYNSAGSPVGSDPAALLAALQTWTDVPTSTFAYAYGGTTSRCPSLYDGCPGPQVFDGFNDVGWAALPGGVLGVATYGIGIDEMDIIIDNDTFAWHTGGLPVPAGMFDLETVNLHELGHGLGLSHSGTSGAVMYPSVGAGQAKRVLHQDDMDGVSFIYPGGSPAPTATPPPPADTPTPTSTPPPAPTDTPLPPSGDTPTPTPTPLVPPADTPTPTPTPEPSGSDSDGDGCDNANEQGSNPIFGGLRNPNNPWDFFDTPAGTPPARDKMVNIIDIAAIVLRFGTVSDPPPTEEEALAEAFTPPPDLTSYHAAFDRGGPIPGEDLWDLLPPNGSINIIDIGAAIVQFGHTCAGGSGR